MDSIVGAQLWPSGPVSYWLLLQLDYCGLFFLKGINVTNRYLFVNFVLLYEYKYIIIVIIFKIVIIKFLNLKKSFLFQVLKTTKICTKFIDQKKIF